MSYGGNVFVYIISAAGSGTIKIGKSNAPEQRLSDLQVGCPFELRILRKIECGSEARALVVENIGHDLLRDYAARGEWFRRPEDMVLEKIIGFLIGCATGRADAAGLPDNEARRFMKEAVYMSRLRLRGRRKANQFKRFVKSQIKAALR